MADTLRTLANRLESMRSLEDRLESAVSLEARSASPSHLSVADAVTLINSVVFLPDWTFTAEPFTKRFQDAVKIRVNYAARNSDRPEAPEYNTWIPGGARAEFVIQVTDCLGPDDVMRKLLTEVIMPIFEHEAREFLRYPDSLDAPFHPHRWDTMAAWGHAELDLKFGVA
jgi:hypothetical protein